MTVTLISFGIIVIIICILLYVITSIKYHKIPVGSFSETFKAINIPIIAFTIGDNTYNFLIDTGSSSSHIYSEIAKKYGENYKEVDVSCTGAGAEINFSSVCILNLTRGKYNFPGVLFFSSPSLDASLTAVSNKFNIPIYGLLGGDFLDQYKFIINYNDQYIYRT